MFNLDTYECPRCQIGHCHPGKTTFTRLHHGRLISVPDMTVYTCDVCGFQEFDPEAMTILQRLLGHATAQAAEEARKLAKSALLDAADIAKKTQLPKP
jgi:YgiT-type zinc finger domain-containing protein